MWRPVRPRACAACFRHARGCAQAAALRDELGAMWQQQEASAAEVRALLHMALTPGRCGRAGTPELAGPGGF